MKTGEIIKNLRTQAGFTLEELANKLTPAVQKATILRWESGAINSIKGEYLEQLSKIFNVSTSYLVTGTNEKIIAKEVALWDSISAMFGSDAVSILHEYTELTSEGKKKAREHISDLWKVYHA